MIVSPYELILYFSQNHISFITNKVDAGDHNHYYIQLTVGLEQNVAITIEGQPMQVPGCILQSNVTHQLQGHRQWQWYLLINPQSTFGELVKRTYLKDSSVFVLDKNQAKELQQLAAERLFSVNDQVEYDTAMQLCMQILRINENSQKTSLDDRIREVLHTIDTYPPYQLTVKDLSQRMYISESRLSHIFKNKVGISLASYLVHHKLETAFQAIFNGKSMTEAAIEAGFNSSSHFSRTVKDKLGMTARAIVQHSRFLKV
ncbi:AraC family transcriptional regulator [Paenibacillus sp.]|jgi:AraC-like DNA-binding protein|uniref:AraC family transcriptional regulator n=1 Tax=Paenibacillus sp. TaxID=58172 RepID=UPI00281CD77A|nr:AraC family transcriptional regulator [Paenibacillus sp.]MDR0269424.1 AraC family transcriptional regulator [Paenibacillus sp.]